MFNFIKDVLFPSFCLQCGDEGKYLCKQCLDMLEPHVISRCPVCNKMTYRGKTCLDCQSDTNLDGVLAFFDYDKSGIIRKLLTDYKYNYARDIELVWPELVGRIIYHNRELFEDLDQYSWLAVPLHWRKLRERGYNQSQYFVEQFCCLLNKESIVGLKRTKYTQQQARLNKKERQSNLINAFEWKYNIKHPKKIILIDDVYTTGTTLNACSKILKQNGVVEVYGLCLARGNI